MINDTLTVTDIFALVGATYAIFKFVIALVSKVERNEIVEKSNYDKIKKEVDDMCIDVDQFQKKITALDKKICESIVHQRYHSEKVDKLDKKFDKNSDKLDKILESLIK